MRAQLKQCWIQALRSGEYIQTRGHLRVDAYDKTFHCAMGVLYDLIATAHQWERLRLAKGSSYFSAYLPIEVYEETRLNPDIELRVATLNDQGQTFEQIADIIERDVQAEPEVAQYVTDQLTCIAALAPIKIPQLGYQYFGLWKHNALSGAFA